MSLSLLQRSTHTIALNPLISPLKPLNPTTLKRIRNILEQNSSVESQLDRSSTTRARNAAVLIPFCNVGGEPGILLELRAMTLRSHSGEIRRVTQAHHIEVNAKKFLPAFLGVMLTTR
jgi:nudix motif 8